MIKVDSRKKNRKLRLYWLASILFCSIIIAFIVYDMIYSPNSPVEQPQTFQNFEVNLTQIENIPEENDSQLIQLTTPTLKNNPLPDNNIQITRLGGARGTTFDNIKSKINNFTTHQYIPVSEFNTTNQIENIELIFYHTNDTASKNIKTTRGKHYIKFDILGTPPESVKLLVDANGLKTIVALYNAKLLRWQTVYVETGEVGLNESLSLKFIFLEDTPLKYANTEFDRNVFIRDINIITLK